MATSLISTPSCDLVPPGGLQSLSEPEALVLRLLVEKRAHQRELQRDVAGKAAILLAELGVQARAADLDLLVTLLDLAAAEAETECSRWGDQAR